MKCSIGANNDLKPIDDEKLRLAAETLKAVAHPVRLRIIEILEKGEKSVTQICAKLGTKQSLTSQQLNRMKDKGVLNSRREGNLVYYSIANPRVIKVIHCIRQSAEDL
ncbi:MAG TPA: ArsR family transcriptional regulator [Deltaproteobacteria bacterium]|nr:MAG: transcriptional regulator [Deltaproteobacteria bacterium]HDM78809.1 ArsR family transcriptional regulator [Deltaproteobacteria bacterium]